jgi:hypothetical protein
MTVDKRDKFHMDFIGYTQMGSVKVIEATLALSHDYDIIGVTSAYISKDGSRVLTLILRPSTGKLGRKGYSLKEEWAQKPDGTDETKATSEAHKV